MDSDEEAGSARKAKRRKHDTDEPSRSTKHYPNKVCRRLHDLQQLRKKLAQLAFGNKTGIMRNNNNNNSYEMNETEQQALLADMITTMNELTDDLNSNQFANLIQYAQEKCANTSTVDVNIQVPVPPMQFEPETQNREMSINTDATMPNALTEENINDNDIEFIKRQLLEELENNTPSNQERMNVVTPAQVPSSEQQNLYGTIPTQQISVVEFTEPNEKTYTIPYMNKNYKQRSVKLTYFHLVWKAYRGQDQGFYLRIVGAMAGNNYEYKTIDDSGLRNNIKKQRILPVLQKLNLEHTVQNFGGFSSSIGPIKADLSDPLSKKLGIVEFNKEHEKGEKAGLDNNFFFVDQVACNATASNNPLVSTQACIQTVEPFVVENNNRPVAETAITTSVNSPYYIIENVNNLLSRCNDANIKLTNLVWFVERADRFYHFSLIGVTENGKYCPLAIYNQRVNIKVIFDNFVAPLHSQFKNMLALFNNTIKIGPVHQKTLETLVVKAFDIDKLEVCQRVNSKSSLLPTFIMTTKNNIQTSQQVYYPLASDQTPKPLPIMLQPIPNPMANRLFAQPQTSALATSQNSQMQRPAPYVLPPVTGKCERFFYFDECATAVATKSTARAKLFI